MLPNKWTAYVCLTITMFFFYSCGPSKQELSTENIKKDIDKSKNKDSDKVEMNLSLRQYDGVGLKFQLPEKDGIFHNILKYDGINDFHVIYIDNSIKNKSLNSFQIIIQNKACPLINKNINDFELDLKNLLTESIEAEYHRLAITNTHTKEIFLSPVEKLAKPSIVGWLYDYTIGGVVDINEKIYLLSDFDNFNGRCIQIKLSEHNLNSHSASDLGESVVEEILSSIHFVN